MYNDVFIAGIGGQGILVLGNIVAEAALAAGHHVTFLPSYGVEMRGGNANCTVVISDKEIGSPSINAPQTVIALATRAHALYENKVPAGGLYIVNSSVVPKDRIKRTDLDLVAMPFNEMAAEMGNVRLANMIALGVYVGKTKVVQPEFLEEGMKVAISERNHKFIPQNMEAIKKGMELGEK